MLENKKPGDKMSTTTTNLGLFKYTESDYDQNFNFNLALNDNWDKLDTVFLNYQLINQPINILASSGTITLSDNSVNTITPTGNVTFTLPTITDNTTFHQILVQVNLSTVYTISLGTSYYFNKTAPDMSIAGIYNLIYEYDNSNQYWVVGCITKGTA